MFICENYLWILVGLKNVKFGILKPKWKYLFQKFETLLGSFESILK
jgi:hypothetical protein